MFEQFSRGYYLGRLYVEPRDGTIARMCHDQYRRVAAQLYGDGESHGGGETTATTPTPPATPTPQTTPPSRPLVMKLGTRHFPVHGEQSVPADTLSVPPAVLDDADVDNPPSLREVLLATADRAAQLLRLTNGAVDEGGVPRDVDGADGLGSSDGLGGSGGTGSSDVRDGSDGPAGI